MSAHRTNYAPAPAPRRRLPKISPEAWYALIGFVVLVIVVNIAISWAEKPLADPLFPIERGDPLELAQIRAEAFRAGYRAAIEDSCKAPTLSWPVAAK